MNGTDRPVALLLPGQGSQHLRMAAGLLDAEPVFAEAMDEALTALTDLGGHSTGLREDWLGTADTAVMDHVTRSQPLLFAVDYALGRLVLDRGVRPVALLGHSIGEVAAAVLSGVFTLRDAAALVHDRVGRLAHAPPGGMVAVAATQDEVAPFLTDGVVVGAVNALRQTVLAGLDEPLRGVTAALADAGFVLQRVPASTAFHSPSLAPAMRGAGERIAALPVGEPRIPVMSGYTARFLTPAETKDPSFWSRHPVAPVLFWPALDALLAEGDLVLVETGPGQGLSQLARRHPAVRSGRSSVVPLLPARPGTPAQDVAAVRAAAGALGV
ncbi:MULTISPECIES: acyltransferase domain-containing protein [Streptomyces]|uniref:Acyltransferase domain-containing protein n=1 Tax=Streptomyces koelreuteriae TaxID=2838015 RepID=A0ABX8FS34_9ACTN|nr:MULTISPECIES: acyltransferase domain-containing protein [Streptomyces]QWB23991.1 acyltransferase domain-containing protein [Streptomyces koelreuteriae]UUA06973.1 acyltransferase domain-containing protein [Streptomyces koelreuteriae]UUA14602.1 acyltransferase domain-containing protein [Streptomyces sp. CRCS-T-1]